MVLKYKKLWFIIGILVLISTCSAHASYRAECNKQSLAATQITSVFDFRNLIFWLLEPGLIFPRVFAAGFWSAAPVARFA